MTPTPSTETTALRAAGAAVELDRSVQIAALRFFDEHRFSATLRDVLGASLPETLRLSRGRRAGIDPFILAWRAPTETWLLCASTAPIDAVRDACARTDDCRVVVQTGGILALHATGPRTRELLCRLGSTASIPGPGEARSGRFADVTVTVLGLDADEMLLLVERGYAEHLLGWIRETLADF